MLNFHICIIIGLMALYIESDIIDIITAAVQ